MASPYVPVAQYTAAAATMTEIEVVTIPAAGVANDIESDKNAAQAAATATAALVPISAMMLVGA